MKRVLEKMSQNSVTMATVGQMFRHPLIIGSISTIQFRVSGSGLGLKLVFKC